MNSLQMVLQDMNPLQMVLQDESEEELIQDGALLAFLQFNGISNERSISS